MRSASEILPAGGPEESSRLVIGAEVVVDQIEGTTQAGYLP